MIVITGVAGFIGSNLAVRLLKQGERVVGIDNFLSGKRKNIESLNGNFSFEQVDIRKTEKLINVFNGASTVFHLAAFVSVPGSIENPILSHDHNVNGTVSVLDAARQAGVKRIVFASSAAVYGNTIIIPTNEETTLAPESPYALHKIIGEQYLSLYDSCYGLETIACRFFNVFGPQQDPNSAYAAAIPKIIKRILNGQSPIVYGDGGQTRDFIFVNDVVEGLICASNAHTSYMGKVYNLGSGSCISINDLVIKIKNLTNSNLPIIYNPLRFGDVYHSQSDISKARNELGFNPSSNMDENLKRTIEWYKVNF